MTCLGGTHGNAELGTRQGEAFSVISYFTCLTSVDEEVPGSFFKNRTGVCDGSLQTVILAMLDQKS